MKKLYVFALAAAFSPICSFAQTGILNSGEEEMTARPEDKVHLIDNYEKPNIINAKAYGDTLWYEDFGGGLPTGWSIVNNNANSFQWEWNTTYRAGLVGPVSFNSPTAANGFMSLPMDFYNTPRPPQSAGGSVDMDTYFQTSAITITPKTSVFIRWTHTMAYCCSGADSLVIEASADGINWDKYDATNDLPINFSSGTVQLQLNLSKTLANSSTAYLRFYADQPEVYWWMVDDIALIEGPANYMVLENESIEFNDTSFAINPFYGGAPWAIFPEMATYGEILNNGGASRSSVSLEVSVDHDTYPGGVPGQGNIYFRSQQTGVSGSGGILAPLERDTEFVTYPNRFVPIANGQYTINITAAANGIEQITGDDFRAFGLTISDSILRRDDNGLSQAGVGPQNYVDGTNGLPGGSQDGDRFGHLMVIEPNANTGTITTTTVPTSISYFVSNDTNNIGVQILPKIWEFDESAATVNAAFGAEVASNFVPYVVTANDTNSLLTLGLNSGTSMTSGLPKGQYVVGWEVIGGSANGKYFDVRQDGSSAPLQPNVSCFLFLGHAPADGWGWVDVQPAIRLNMSNLPPNPNTIGLTENESDIVFGVAPNPSNGDIKVSIKSENQVDYTLNVRNMLGQIVHTDLVSVSGSKNIQLDLTSYEKGVYFVSLENENDKLLKKVVLK